MLADTLASLGQQHFEVSEAEGYTHERTCLPEQG